MEVLPGQRTFRMHSFGFSYEVQVEWAQMTSQRRAMLTGDEVLQMRKVWIDILDNLDAFYGNLVYTHAQIAAMRKQGSKTWTNRNGSRDIGRGVIVNIASANSFVGLPGKGCYTISKHASMGVTKMAGKCPTPS